MIRLQRIALYLLLVASLLALNATSAERTRNGEEIYRADCARCHGPSGEGVADKHDEPLYGDRSVRSLARLIARTMPEDRDEKTSPAEAEKVAAYIYDAFYSPAARARLSPARVQLARLTVRQYQNAVADVLGSFREQKSIGDERGLKAEYYNSRNFRNDKKAFDRVDQRVEFNFGDSSPDTNKVDTKEFAIKWEGSLIAEETGDYEFCLKT